MAAPNIENIKKPVAALYPVVDELRCVELMIPDDDGYLWILAGFVSILGQSWSWSGSLDDRLARAYLWIKAYEQTDWMQCMNCEQLIACITPLFEAQTSQILNEIRYGDGLTVPPGTKPPDSQNSANQAGATNPECNLDIVWAQCQQMVAWLVGLANSAFNIAETASNDTELVGALTELPIIQEVGIAAVADYINLLLEGVAENFAAQATPEYMDTYACLLMQECCNDCVVTVDRLFAAASKRMRTHFADFPTTFATIFDLWSYLSDQDINGTIVFDFAMMLGIGGGSLANAFFADVGTRSLQTVLLLAVNDANDDWLILCPDCPACDISFTVDPNTEVDDEWVPAEQALITPLPGGSDADGRRSVFTFASPITSAQFDFTWHGARDGVFAQLGDGSVVSNSTDDTGNLQVFCVTPSDTLVIDTGYSAEDAYPPERYAGISNVQGCE